MDTSHEYSGTRTALTNTDAPTAELSHSAIGQWGAVASGTIAGLATTLVMGTLGLAIGATAVDPDAVNDGSKFGMAAVGWTLFTAVIVGLVAGATVARAARTDRPYHGPILGLVTWGAGLALGAMLFAATSGGAAGGLGAAAPSLLSSYQANRFDLRTNDTARNDAAFRDTGTRPVDASVRRDADAPRDLGRDGLRSSDPVVREDAKKALVTAAWTAFAAQIVGLLFTMVGAKWQRRRTVEQAVRVTTAATFTR